MAKRPQRIGGVAAAAVQVLGTLVAQRRRERGWTQSRLADAVGVSHDTIAGIERGEPTVAIGTFFQACAVLAIPLFGADRDELQRQLREGRDRLALLPDRVRIRNLEIDDDF